jgi:hypothetical protein
VVDAGLWRHVPGSYCSCSHCLRDCHVGVQVGAGDTSRLVRAHESWFVRADLYMRGDDKATMSGQYCGEG